MNVRARQHVKVCIVRDEGNLPRRTTKPLRSLKFSVATTHLPCHKSRQDDRTFHLRVSAASHPDRSIASICAFMSSTSESQTLATPTLLHPHGNIKDPSKSSTSVEPPNSNAEMQSKLGTVGTGVFFEAGEGHVKLCRMNHEVCACHVLQIWLRKLAVATFGRTQYSKHLTCTYTSNWG